MNGSGSGRKWAPFAIGALVVLIVLGLIYYFYYYKSRKCIENNVRRRFPGADDDLVTEYTKWEAANAVTITKGDICPEIYNTISTAEDDCTICETKNLPELPQEIRDKMKKWVATPQGATAVSNLPRTGVAAPPPS